MTGTILSCRRSITESHTLPAYAFQSLRVWHSGLSCQLRLRSGQFILSNADATPKQQFLAEFYDEDREQIYEDEEGNEHKVFRVFMLTKGTVIPDRIGIEQDGENHVTMYPKSVPFTVKKCRDWSVFQVDGFVPLVERWKPFALLSLKAGGFKLPSYFPDDSDFFPFRHFIREIIINGSAENAVRSSDLLHHLASDKITLLNFLRSMAAVGSSHLLACDDVFTFTDIVKPCIATLQFWSKCLVLATVAIDVPLTLVVKSHSLDGNKEQETAFVANQKNEISMKCSDSIHLASSRSVIECVGSIDIVYLNATILTHSPTAVFLPFWYENTSLGIKALFNDIDIPFCEEDDEAKCSSVVDV
jgi:hypothetical protein